MRSLLFFAVKAIWPFQIAKRLIYYRLFIKNHIYWKQKNGGRIYGGRDKQSDKNNNKYSKNRNRNNCCNNCNNICDTGSNDDGENYKRNKNQESGIQKDKC